MKNSELKKMAKESTDITIVSITKDRKYEGYNMKYYVSCDNYTTETRETYFNNLDEIECMLIANTIVCN
jgi:hypothetical protein